MDSTQRSEFEAQLGALFGAWGRTTWEATTEGYWKGLQHMGLADFTRCVDKAIQGLAETSDAKLPNVGALWAIKRSLRATALPRPQAPADDWKGDKWDSLANNHLWNYLLRNAHHAQRYHSDSTYSPKLQCVIPGPIGTQLTGVLVRWKNEWAAAMRHEPAADHGKALWAECMEAAEAEISAHLVQAKRA